MKSHKFLFVLAVLMIALAQFMTAPAPVAAATLCDAAQFVADVTIPDGTLMQPGQAFTKTWRLKNIGSCAWETTYKLAFSSGESMGAATASQLASKVAPGQTIDITLNMTAPSVAGTYRSNWVLKNASGTAFGIGAAADKPFYVEIRVASSAGTGYDFAANAANANWSSGAGTLTFPGTDGDAKGFGLKLDTPKLETGTVDSSAGLLMFPQNTFNGYIQAQYPAFTVQSGDRFQSIINCEYNATSCYVNFRLDYQIGSNPVKTYWSFNEKYEGLYYRADLDLSALAGQDVKFILRVGTAGFATGDRALWGAPRIVRGMGGGTVTPSLTPSPTAIGPTKTPTPTSSISTCDRVSFVADVSVPDGMNFNPGTAFTKTWRLKNVGTCTWSTAYTLVFVSGDKLGGPDASALPQAVAPGQTIDISVPLTAPAATGTYRGYWQFKNAAGALFGIGANFDKPWWVDIRVVSGTLVPTFTPTATKTPTPTVTGPTKTPTPTSSVSTCDRVSFVADVSVPDGMNFNPGTTFTKTWRLKNVGTCTWSTAYTLVFVSGDKMGGPDASALPQAVAPGQTIDISVPLTAPAATGTYRGYWQFKNATGLLFGIGAKFDKPWWVDIRVVGPTATPSITLTPTATTTPATATPTRTPTPTGQPVTLGYDFAANASSANWSSGAGALPFPGADGDARGFAIKFDTVQIETGGTDNSGAILTVPQNIYNGYIRGVYPAYSVKSGDKFQVMLGCQYSATLCYITYQLDYEENSVVKTFWSFSEKYEGQVYNASVDLSPLAGKTVKFILAVSAAGNATGDRALWVGPRISSSTGATTPTPTATPATTSWALYENPHGFSFKIPYPPNINAESPQKVHLTLPITAGTNLSEKYIDLVVTENASSCKTTLSGEDATKQQTVTFNGFSFNKQAGGDAGAGNYYTWSAYSTWRGTTCISMGFVLHSTNAANYPTPPPLFNETAESAVFTMIMDSFRLYYGPYAVMDVTTNDVLNIRAGAGTSNPVVASFPYNATNVTRTGPTSMISGSKWVEVKTPSNSLGWVNSFYLTEYIDKTAFCADSKIALLLADLKSAITTSDGDKFSGLVSPIHGVDIYNAAGGKRNTFTPALAQTAFTSTTSYDWGAAPASGLPVSGSFKDVILPKMLDVFNNAGYATYCETPKAGAVNWDGVWGGEYANIRYYSLNRPGELDWRTWVAGIEYIDAKPYVTVLMQFQWEP